MVITEKAEIGDMHFRKTYSDQHLIIKKNGTDELYEEAYDVLDSSYNYEETDKPILPVVPVGSVENVGESENTIA